MIFYISWVTFMRNWNINKLILRVEIKSNKNE